MTYQLTSDCAAHVRGENGPPLATRVASTLKQKFVNGLARHLSNRQARIDRAAFRQMLSLEDEILDDIGVTRANVEWASQLPIHQSAAQALDATKKRARPRIRP